MMKIIYARLLMLILLTAFVLCACGNKQDTLYTDGERYDGTEVPTEQESIDLEEIGVTLILPDSWKGKYEVIEGVFEPYNSTMWEFCVKSIYDAQTPTDESGQVLYRGTLFVIFQYTNYFMSEEEFEQSGIARIGRYLFATENATYALVYTTDLQYDWNNAEQKEEWNAMEQSIQDIQFVVETEETEIKETGDKQLLSGFNNRIIETVLRNGETGGAIAASDVTVDQTIYGSFSKPETKEVLVICKILNMPHAGGLDRRAIIILEMDSMDVVAYAEIPADEVWVDTLPMSNGQDRIIFSGKTTYQGISVQTIMYFGIQDGRWAELPAEELESLGENCFYYLLGDKMIVTSGRELADSSDITAILTWNQDEGKFTLESIFLNPTMGNNEKSNNDELFDNNTQVNDWFTIQLPEGYTISEYKENVGNEGGVLIEPQAYEVLGEDSYGYGMDWTMSGSIGIISNVEDIFIFEDDKLTDVMRLWNHSSYEKIEILDDLVMPAILYHVNHDLYTAADMGKLEEQGIDLSPEDTTSDYWYIFFAKEDGAVGYYLALDQRQFNREDALNVAKTVKFVS